MYPKSMPHLEQMIQERQKTLRAAEVLIEYHSPDQPEVESDASASDRGSYATWPSSIDGNPLPRVTPQSVDDLIWTTHALTQHNILATVSVRDLPTLESRISTPPKHGPRETVKLHLKCLHHTWGTGEIKYRGGGMSHWINHPPLYRVITRMSQTTRHMQ